MGRIKIASALLFMFALGAASVGAIWSANNVSTEVRISARELDDGRVEFALQQSDGDSWGDRLLPSSRLFPASVDDSRWLNSSPLTLRVALPDASDDLLEEEVPETQASPDSAASPEADSDSYVEENDAEYLVEIISLRSSTTSYGAIGYSVVLRNNTNRQIRSVGIQVQARNNVGIVQACSTVYEYICDRQPYSYAFNVQVDRGIVSGKTLTLTRSSVRGWSLNDDIETLTAEIATVEFRSGTPTTWRGCPGASFYCPDERQSVTVRRE